MNIRLIQNSSVARMTCVQVKVKGISIRPHSQQPISAKQGLTTL